MNTLKKLILPGWILGFFALFLYSYTQVDLSLTLSQASIFQTVEKGFQYIGYFNRPLSTYLYIGVFTFLFVLYFATLHLVSQERLSRKAVWIIIICGALILTFSYSAFSYDIFNYIFDARIITHYGQNPYIHKALDFPGDPMLSFMRWTHRVYPYGPIWLALTVPLTYIGGEIFLITFFLFKMLMASFFLLTVYLIEKIARTKKIIAPLLAVVAFGLNPFVLSESLVSSHNDIVMMGLATMAVYFLFENSRKFGLPLFILSVGIKYATILLAFAYGVFALTKSYHKYLVASVILMLVAVVIVAKSSGNFQPWYLLYPAPFVALLFHRKVFSVPAIIMSIAAVAFYIPFLYTGNWDPPIPTILNSLIAGSAFCSLIIVISLLARRLRR